MEKNFQKILESSSGIKQVHEYLSNTDFEEDLEINEKFLQYLFLKLNLNTVIESIEFLNNLEVLNYVNILIEKHFENLIFEKNSEILFLEALFEKKGNC
jgi:hypothetical protein